MSEGPSEGDPDGRSREGPEAPAPLRRFLELFNAGRYWDSHEALEDAWRERDSGFYHGLILYASAFVHARRDNRHGILAQLEKARRALEPCRPTYLGLDVDAILEHAARCRSRVEAVGSPAGERGWLELLPEPRLEVRPDRFRGDEPELAAGADGQQPGPERGPDPG